MREHKEFKKKSFSVYDYMPEVPKTEKEIQWLIEELAYTRRNLDVTRHQLEYFDSWSNDACLGYLLNTLYCLNIEDEKQIQEFINQMNKCFDRYTLKEAEEIFLNWYE